MTLAQEIDAYAQIPAVNWSSLKWMGDSPKMFKHRRDNPEPRKASFVFGGAVHCDTLEPEKFAALYTINDDNRNSNAWKDWKAAHPGVEAFKTPQMARVKRTSKAVRENRDADKILRVGRREEPLVWTDPELGIRCKARIDHISPRCITELKTAHTVKPAAFERAAFQFGYAAQCAFYHDGATVERRIDGKIRPHIIAVKTKDDHDVVTFQLEPEVLEFGRAQYRRLLRRLAECMEADYWPGVAPGVQPLYLPPYVQNDNFSFDTENESEDF